MAMAFVIVALLSLATGCVTPQQKEWTCNTAQAAFEGYKAAQAAGHKAEPAELISVAGAAQFLRIYCKWESPFGGSRGLYTVDENWIPILVPPLVR